MRRPSRTSRSQTVNRRVEESAGKARWNAPQFTIKSDERTLEARLCTHVSGVDTVDTVCRVCTVVCGRRACVACACCAVLRSALRRFASRTAHGIQSLSHMPPWVVSHGGSKRVEHTSTAAYKTECYRQPL